jgi:hypothetical protein
MQILQLTCGTSIEFIFLLTRGVINPPTQKIHQTPLNNIASITRLTAKT